MDKGITGFDHPIIKMSTIADLDILRDFLSGIGFTYAQRLNTGSLYSDRIVFQHSYFALIAVTDQERMLTTQASHHALSDAGISKIFYQTWDASATSVALAESGIPVRLWHFVVPLERPADEGGRIDTAHRIMELDTIADLSLRLAVCHHLMPDVLFRSAWTAHRNGAQEIVKVTAVADDPGSYRRRYAGFFGEDACWTDDGSLLCTTPRDTLEICTPDAFRRRHPGCRVPNRTATPVVGLVTIRVSDLTSLRGHLESAGVETRPAPGNEVVVELPGLDHTAFAFVAE